jgi:hypothetical protein
LQGLGEMLSETRLAIAGNGGANGDQRINGGRIQTGRFFVGKRHEGGPQSFMRNIVF